MKPDPNCKCSKWKTFSDAEKCFYALFDPQISFNNVNHKGKQRKKARQLYAVNIVMRHPKEAGFQLLIVSSNFKGRLFSITL